MSRQSKLFRLDPFLDEDNILRVGGKIRNACLPFNQRFPIILPKCHLSELIIRSNHNPTHANNALTENLITKNFWIFSLRRQIKDILSHCTKCIRMSENFLTQKMADQPNVRLDKALPFERTGVDLCGPFLIKSSPLRNAKKIKVYIATFVCLLTKATHVEVVRDLSTDSFMNAFTRFYSRRNLCKEICKIR